MLFYASSKSTSNGVCGEGGGDYDKISPSVTRPIKLPYVAVIALNAFGDGGIQFPYSFSLASVPACKCKLWIHSDRNWNRLLIIDMCAQQRLRSAWTSAQSEISLGIRPVWSESSLSARRNIGSSATHLTHSKDSDQTGRIPRLIWVFSGRTGHFVGFVMRRLYWFLIMHFPLLFVHHIGFTSAIIIQLVAAI